MAVVEIKCPNCGGAVQLDDTMEKGFCMYCGAAIQVKDEVQKIKIEHSGKVEISGKVQIDETEKINNYYELACNSLKSNNFVEAYLYFSKCLECDVKNWKALYYKGYCAAHIDIRRSSELAQGMSSALNIINSEGNGSLENQLFIYSETIKFAKSIGLSIDKPKFYGKFQNKAEALNYFEIAHQASMLMKAALEIIKQEMIENNPKYEEIKKADLEIAMEIVEKSLHRVSYISGYRTVTKNGKSVTQQENSQITSPYNAIDVQYKNSFISDYNNLPSIKSAIASYDTDLKAHQEKVNLYNRKLNEYFTNNPDKKIAYNKKYATPFIILMSVCFVMIVVLAAVLSEKDMGFICIPLIGFYAFLIVSIVRGIKGKKIRKQIMKNLPGELLELKKQNDISEQKLKEISRLKNQYLANHTKH